MNLCFKVQGIYNSKYFQSDSCTFNAVSSDMTKRVRKSKFFKRTLNTPTIVANRLMVIVCVHEVYGTISSLSMPHHHSYSFLLFSFIFNTRPKIQTTGAFTQTSSRAKVHNQVECQWFCVAGLFFCVCVGCGEKQNVILSLCKAAHILILNFY